MITTFSRPAAWTAAFGLFLATALVPGPTQASPTGIIAGILAGHGVIYDAATGAVRRLPNAPRPWIVSLSPDGGDALYFVTKKTGEASAATQDDAPFTGYVSHAPFDASMALAPPLNTSQPVDVIWAGNDHAFIEGYGQNGLFAAPANRYKASHVVVEDVAADSDWVSYSTASEVHARNMRSGVDKTLFSIARPRALLGSLANAGKAVKDLTDELDPSLAKDADNWAIGKTAISADGGHVYFLCNAGTSEGAQGNTTMCFVRVDVASGHLTVLGRMGTVFGRVPDVFALSPDQRKLLVASSVHNSAADNSEVVESVDIASGRTVDYLAKDTPHPQPLSPPGKGEQQDFTMANIVDGACWSPDSRYVAVSVYYYDTATLSDDSDLVPDTRLEIKDADTGVTLRTVKHFARPCWVR
jgi:hypothetical protein